MGNVFATKIRPKGLDGGGELSTNHGSKVAVMGQKLTAMMHEIEPSETSAIIHKNNIISISPLDIKGAGPHTSE